LGAFLNQFVQFGRTRILREGPRGKLFEEKRQMADIVTYAASLEKRTIAERAPSLQNEAKPNEANSVSRRSHISINVSRTLFFCK